MKRSTLGIGLVSAIVLLSVLVPFQTTHGQSDYVVDTERGTYYTTTTSKEQKGPTTYYVCEGCGQTVSETTYRTWYHYVRITYLDQLWAYTGWRNAWEISTEIRKTKGGLSAAASPCGCELVSSGSGSGGG